jgi:hypothetical protein
MTGTQRKVCKGKENICMHRNIFLHLERRPVLTIDNHFLTSYIKYIDGSMGLIINHNHKL